MESHISSSSKKVKNLSNLPTLGPGDNIGEGDSWIQYNLLLPSLRDDLNPDLSLSDTIFQTLYHEVQWQKMYHAAGEVPRLVAVQGTVDKDGSKPVYRHPSDQSPPLMPFSKHVNIVRKEAERLIGHPLNHVLIQLYRSGNDYISEHSDKTLDILRGSTIVNASFGAQRTMRLRTKKIAKRDDKVPDTPTGLKQLDGTQSVGVERTTQRIALPHNSLFVLGLKTNQFWLHGITQDKRLPHDRSDEELAYESMRISLTFRHIGTFLNANETLIWGQGATSKDREGARRPVNANDDEAEKMIDAFGFENKEGAEFDWDSVYGNGFDMLNMRILGTTGQAAVGSVTEGAGS